MGKIYWPVLEILTESDRQKISKNPSSNQWPYFIFLEGLNYEVKFFHQPRERSFRYSPTEIPAVN